MGGWRGKNSCHARCRNYRAFRRDYPRHADCTGMEVNWRTRQPRGLLASGRGTSVAVRRLALRRIELQGLVNCRDGTEPCAESGAAASPCHQERGRTGRGRPATRRRSYCIIRRSPAPARSCASREPGRPACNGTCRPSRGFRKTSQVLIGSMRFAVSSTTHSLRCCCVHLSAEIEQAGTGPAKGPFCGAFAAERQNDNCENRRIRTRTECRA